MKATGFEELILKMQNVAQKVPDGARKVMNRTAPKIVELAKMMAPEDDAELTDSIHMEKTYEDRGRLVINIIAGGIVRGVDVDRYATQIHEHYDTMKMGPISILKQQIYPDVIVGGHFLTRAADEFKPKLEAAMIVAATEDMSELEE